MTQNYAKDAAQVGAPPDPAAIQTLIQLFQSTGLGLPDGPTEVTIAELVVALYAAGINILTPKEQLDRDKNEEVARDAKRARLAAITLAFEETDAKYRESLSAAASAAEEEAAAAAAEKEAAAAAAAEETPAVPGSSSGTAIPGTITGFVCVNCKAYNLLRPSKDTWYCITVGLGVGVFQDWNLASPLVNGIRKAVYKKKSSQAAALESFRSAKEAGLVKIVNPDGTLTTVV